MILLTIQYQILQMNLFSYKIHKINRMLIKINQEQEERNLKVIDSNDSIENIHEKVINLVENIIEE